MIRKDLIDFLKSIPSNITLVAATKYVTTDDLKLLKVNGIHHFGENRVDAFLSKYNELGNKDISWHFIGHLQRNKAKVVINKIDYLHSLDSLELAKIIDKERQTPLKCFVEVSINLEASKNGVPYMELESFIKELLKYKNIQLIGLMMMSIKYSDESSLHSQFAKLRKLRDEMEKKLNIRLPELSMGMSDDYLAAIDEGATYIRLGRILFDLM